MRNSLYDGLNINQSFNSYISTQTISTKEMRKCVAKANDYKITNDPNIEISIGSNDILMDTMIPDIPIIDGIEVLDTKPVGQYDILEMDVTSLSQDIGKPVNDPNSLNNNTHTNSRDEDIFLKYALDNTADVLRVLVNNIGKKFEIITEKDNFSIIIDRENIPHLLGFLAPRYVLNINSDRITTRFYEAIREEFQKGNRDYVKNIINIINNYKKEIFESIKNIDDIRYQKELWNKIASKAANLKTLEDLLKINAVNNIEIFEDKNSDIKDTHLLLSPISGEDNYIALVIEKEENKESYYVKSDCLITKNNYSRTNLYLERKHFRKVNVLETVIIADSDKEINSFNESNEKAKEVKNQNLFSRYRRYSLPLDEYKKSNKNVLKILNNEDIKNKINFYLGKNLSSDELKEILPELLTKYFITSNKNNEELNRFYYLLAEFYCNDLEILDSIKNCFEKNKEEIKNKIYSNNENEFTSSIVKADSLYIKLNITLNDTNISSYSSYVSNFGNEYENIKNYIKNILNEINNIKINSNDDVMRLLYLLNTYYELNILFNTTIEGINSYSNISNYTINELKNNYSFVFDRLIKIGFLNKTNIKDFPIINYNSFEELENNYNMELNDYLKKIIEDIKNTNNSNKISYLLENLSKDEIEYVLFKVELSLLKSITSLLQNESSKKEYLPEINRINNKLMQINNIRKNSLKYNYVKTLKMAG